MNNITQDHGVINAYDSFKGIGFIRREKGRDVFFMDENLVTGYETIQLGDHVSFKLNKTSKGPRAEEIQKLI